MKISGSIPKTLTFYCRKSDDGISGWNEPKKEGVFNTFCADKDNTKTNEHALSWATRHSGKDDDYFIVEMENKPFTGVKIVGLQGRERSGNVFKAIAHDKYAFDFRDEVLFDAMHSKEGISNGVINCEVIFATVGSQMKLIVVGSETHNQMLELGEKKQVKKIPNKELKEGGIYSTAGGEKFIYIGNYYNYPILTTKDSYYSREKTYVYENPVVSMVFLKYDETDDFTNPNKWQYIPMEFKKSHSFNQFYGLDSRINPKTIITFMNELTLTQTKETFKDRNKYANKDYDYGTLIYYFSKLIFSSAGVPNWKDAIYREYFKIFEDVLKSLERAKVI